MKIVLKGTRFTDGKGPIDYELTSNTYGVTTLMTIADIMSHYCARDKNCVFSGYQKVHELDESVQISLESKMSNKQLMETCKRHIHDDLLNMIASFERLLPEEQFGGSPQEPDFEPTMSECFDT